MLVNVKVTGGLKDSFDILVKTNIDINAKIEIRSISLLYLYRKSSYSPKCPTNASNVRLKEPTHRR